MLDETPKVLIQRQTPYSFYTNASPLIVFTKDRAYVLAVDEATFTYTEALWGMAEFGATDLIAITATSIDKPLAFIQNNMPLVK